MLNRHGNRVKPSAGISGKNFGERGMTSRKPSIYRWHCKYPNKKYFKTSQSLRGEEISKEAEGSAARRIAGQRIYRNKYVKINSPMSAGCKLNVPRKTEINMKLTKKYSRYKYIAPNFTVNRNMRNIRGKFVRKDQK